MTAKSSKQPKPWSRVSPEGPWDDIVVGSGMGGMTAAAMLARLGRRVLVLEQHYVPGGFTHTFPRKGFVWDVGVHAVGGVTRHSMSGRLLERLTDGRLTWASLGSVYDEFHFPEGFRIDFPDNPSQFRENLIAAFPEEQPAIDDYLTLVREVSGAMRGFYLSRALPRRLVSAVEWLLARRARHFLGQSVREVMDGLTRNPELRAVLTAQWGYYGAPPSRASFAVQALVTQHFMHGGYYPVGGSGQIARELLRTVADAGGWTRILADVEEILVENGRAVGVRLAGGEELRSRRVISAVGVAATANRLLGEAVREEPWATEVEGLTPGPAHVCLYLGFEGDIASVGASGANKWFYNTWDAEEEVWPLEEPAGEPLGPAPVLYCSFPSLKDPEHDPGPELKHTGEVVTFVPWERFDAWRGSGWKKRGEDYDELKRRIHDALLAQFLERMPELAPMVRYSEVSTPVSTDHFVRPVAGSIYGLSPTPDRFRSKWLRPRSPIRGLYFAGSEVAMVGVMGAMFGGLLAAVAAEPLAAGRLLRGLSRAPSFER